MGRQLQAAIEAPYKSLVALFCTWELLLLSIALLSPGPGYDTSTQLLLQGHGISNIELPLREAIAYGSSPIVDRALRKLTRWDAIYFASIAEKGYQLEQEWAFGWGFTRLLSFLATCTCFCFLYADSFTPTSQPQPQKEEKIVLPRFAKPLFSIYILRLVCLEKPSCFLISRWEQRTPVLLLFRFMRRPESCFLLRPDRPQGSAPRLLP